MVISAIITHRPDSTITHCSGDTNELFYCSADELVGKKLHETGLIFYAHEDQPFPAGNHPAEIMLQAKKAINGITLGISHSENNSLVWARFTGYPQLDDKGNIEQVITTYSASSAALQHRALQPEKFGILDDWEKTFNALQDVITVLSPDLKILKANKAAYETFKLNGSEIIGKKCYEVFNDRSEPCECCPASRLHRELGAKSNVIYNERTCKSFEVRSYPILDDSGELKHLLHSARDVTQKIRNEEVRTILSEAIEQTSDSVIITNVDGTIQYVNPSCTTTSGYSREELTGENLNFLVTGAQNSKHFEKATIQLGKGNSWQGRLTSTKKDGSRFEENAAISAITDQKGNITNLVIVKRDISKEEHLQKQLQQAMKMEAIGTLSGGIAHDFNNILAAMIGYAQIAKEKVPEEDSIRDDIDQILLGGDRATQLVKQILTFSRRDTEGSLHPLKIQHLIKEVVKLLRSSFPTTIDIRQKIDNNCPPVLADPAQLHQVLMNLCTNARQAIDSIHGAITIELDKYSIPGPHLQGTSLLNKGTYARLVINDSGKGMSEEMQTRIFDPFFTTKAKNQGTGLGLSVVHGIVERHEGVIMVESEIDLGTTFQIYFPAITDIEDTRQESPEQLNLGSERIMVVDDERPIAELLQQVLTGLGYTVTAYSSSLEAVAEYRKHPDDFDAVITDMTMPDMTGAELAREMLSFRPELPIIMATGYNETIDAEKASRIGIRSFLLKPLKKAKLAQVLRTVLDNGEYSNN